MIENVKSADCPAKNEKLVHVQLSPSYDNAVEITPKNLRIKNFKIF